MSSQNHHHFSKLKGKKISNNFRGSFAEDLVDGSRNLS